MCRLKTGWEGGVQAEDRLGGVVCRLRGVVYRLKTG